MKYRNKISYMICNNCVTMGNLCVNRGNGGNHVTVVSSCELI